jgi:hypothetical protein
VIGFCHYDSGPTRFFPIVLIPTGETATAAAPASPSASFTVKWSVASKQFKEKMEDTEAHQLLGQAIEYFRKNEGNVSRKWPGAIEEMLRRLAAVQAATTTAAPGDTADVAVGGEPQRKRRAQTEGKRT